MFRDPVAGSQLREVPKSSGTLHQSMAGLRQFTAAVLHQFTAVLRQFTAASGDRAKTLRRLPKVNSGLKSRRISYPLKRLRSLGSVMRKPTLSSTFSITFTETKFKILLNFPRISDENEFVKLKTLAATSENAAGRQEAVQHFMSMIVLLKDVITPRTVNVTV